MRAALFVGWLVMCGCDAAGTPATTATKAEQNAPRVPKEAAIAKATAATDALVRGVKQRLITAMSAGGPARALAVCAEEAQAITRRTAEETGVRVGRSSLRLRNPKNQGPSWVTDWLREHAGSQATPHTTWNTRTRTARVLKPIFVDALCLSCHGTEATVSDEVKALLKQHYPSDQATGYQAGDFRGVVWAEYTFAD